MRRGIVALVFRCQIIDGQLRPTSEADESRWMTPSEIRLEMDDAYACRLLDALNTHPPIVRFVRITASTYSTRPHDGRSWHKDPQGTITWWDGNQWVW